MPYARTGGGGEAAAAALFPPTPGDWKCVFSLSFVGEISKFLFSLASNPPKIAHFPPPLDSVLFIRNQRAN